MSRIALPKPNVEALAQQRPPEVNIGPDHADEIAYLAHELTRRALPVVVQATTPSYADLTSVEKQALRIATVRMVQALVMLGWIELPS